MKYFKPEDSPVIIKLIGRNQKYEGIQEMTKEEYEKMKQREKNIKCPLCEAGIPLVK